MTYAGRLASTGNRASLTAHEGQEPWSGAGQRNYIYRDLDVTGAFASYADGANIGADGTTGWGSFLYSGSDDAVATTQNPLRFQLNGTAMNYALPANAATSLVVFPWPLARAMPIRQVFM